MKRGFVLITALAITVIHVFANNLDSLLVELKTAKDSARIIYLNNVIGDSMYNVNIETSLTYYLSAYKFLPEKKNPIQLEMQKSTINNIGTAYLDLGKYDKAFEFYQKLITLAEAENDTSYLAMTNNNIGNLFYLQDETDRAKEYYVKSLVYVKQLGDMEFLSIIYSNLGNIELEGDKYNEALDYFKLAYEISKKTSNENIVLAALGNMAICYTNLGFIDQAIKIFNEIIEISEENNYLVDLLNAHHNRGDAYYQLGDEEAAKADYLKSIDLAKQIGSLDLESISYSKLYIIYKENNDAGQALFYHEKYSETKDSLLNIESRKVIEELNTKYETEKKDNQIKVKNLELEKNIEEIQKQRILTFSFLFGFIIILIFSVLLYKQFKAKKKANILLANQNIEINQKNEEITTQRDEILAQRDLVTLQKEHIEEQKKEIDDSIQYAKRIQSAVLPAKKYSDGILGDHFILFRPHSVVSGDFFWTTQTDEWTIVTVADCTGHGVPGAFMSMLGVSFLNEVVQKKEVTTPAEILNHLRISVIEALKQTGEDGTQKDGMDMSIVAINNQRDHINWAGANNPLWIIRKKVAESEAEKSAEIIEEIKADRMPVAVHVNMDNFTNHIIQIEEGDILYLFSDGLPDQFGGEKGKKFMYKRFKEKLAKTSHFSMKEQGESIAKDLDNWMNYEGNYFEQVDDITVIGIRI